MHKNFHNFIIGVVSLVIAVIIGMPRDAKAGTGAVVQHLVNETNRARSKQGLPPLKQNDKLMRAAQMKADDMARRHYFNHKSPSGITVSDLLLFVRYTWSACGENLAVSTDSPWNDVDQWMRSEGHKRNILDARYNEIGIAVAVGEWQGYRMQFSVQEFGRGR